MSRTKQNKKPRYKPRAVRQFSEELKKQLVEDIEFKRVSIREVVNLYQVSETAVRKWLTKFSIHKQRRTRMVIESESRESKTGQLFERISDLERAVGKKQMEIDFLNRVIEICSEELGYDIKKKNSMKQLSTIESTKSGIDIK